MNLQFAMPKVGSQVRVTTRYKNHVLYIPGEYVETTYTGTVGSTHKLLNPNSFVLSTPETPHFPKREINLGYVVKFEYLDGTKVATVQNNDQTWSVKGSKGDIYTVTRSNNQLICNCSGFQFRRKCKHLDVAKS